jgi:hypothetical protein
MKSIFRLTYLYIFLLFITPVFGQYGLRLHYDQNRYPEWSTAIRGISDSERSLFRHGYGLGFDYWFRLKEKRLEFFPEISYHGASTTYSGERVDKVKQSRAGLSFHTQIYALDFNGDCNCPTFSKEGSTIDKGLFFMFSPGVEWSISELVLPSTSINLRPNTKSENLMGRIGLGVGIDFGWSDFLTLSPMISYNFYSPITWKELEPNNEMTYSNKETTPTLLEASIRVGFRQDSKKSRRR